MTQIRPFVEGDWAQVEAIFREVLAAGETYCGDPAMSEADVRAYWLSDAHTVVAVDEDDSGTGNVLGSAHMGPNRPAQGSHVGTASFIVAASARGRGLGRALAEYVVGWHREQGYRGIQFNAVVESNAAAVHLWEDFGFQVIGTVPGAFRRPSGEYVGLHVMYLDLS
jgi:GNAT superfamily N-acetyltransferase